MTSDSAGSHATMPGQTAFGLNVDGVVTVAWESDPSLLWFHSCTGALITDRQILSSAHCFDENRDGKVDDWLSGIPHVAAFDLAEGRVILPIALAETRFPPQWYETDEAADVAVLQLVDTAPVEAPRYPLYGGRDETSHPFVLVGYGHAGSGATGEEGPTIPYPLKQAGKNQYEVALSDFLVYDFDSGEPAHNALELLGIPSDLGYGIDEVSAAPGDSGRRRLSRERSPESSLAAGKFLNSTTTTSWMPVGANGARIRVCPAIEPSSSRRRMGWHAGCGLLATLTRMVV